MKKYTKPLFCFALAALFFSFSENSYSRNFQQDQSKGIQAEEYLNKRPVRRSSSNKSFRGGTASIPKPARKRYYKIVKSNKPKPGPKPAAKQFETARLGFTMWRVNPEVAENESKGVTEVDLQKSERAGAETLKVGDHFRIGVESLSHNGYLYVINREKFADGSYGRPTLIFPTLSSRGGYNQVQAGILTMLPTSYGYAYRIDPPKEGKQIAEELIIIVSPKILINPGLLQSKAIQVSSDLVGQWLNQYRTEDFQIAELVDGAQEVMTTAEQLAWKEQSKGITEVATTLTQEDVPPHVVYQMKIKRGNPVVTIVTLPIKQN
jgi:hypothetical protein